MAEMFSKKRLKKLLDQFVRGLRDNKNLWPWRCGLIGGIRFALQTKQNQEATSMVRGI